MTAKDWERIPNFSPQENWGNAGLMKLDFIEALSAFRQFIGIPVVITSGTQGTHSSDSLHYIGRAADIVFPRPGDLTLLDIFLAATRFEFTGLGLYRDWSYNGFRIGGIHLEKAKDRVPHRKLWLSIKANEKQEYFPLTQSNLEKFGMIGARI